MLRARDGSALWVLMAVLSIAIAALALSGAIFAHDLGGRLIYGLIWSAVGIGWLSRYILARKAARSGSGTAGE